MNTPTGKLGQYLTTAFDPREFAACTLWLDAGDRDSLTLSGSTVTQWTDKSGTGNTVTGGSGPTYTSNVYNGLGTLSFNGSQFLSRGSVTGGSLAGNNTTTFSMFVVCSFNNNTQRSMAFSWDSSAYTFRILFQYESNTLYFDFNNTTAARTIITSFTPTNNQLYMFSGTRNGSIGYLGVNGGTNSATASGLSTDNFSSTSYTLNIGTYVNDSGYNMKGNVCEIIFYNSALTIPQRQALEGYLAAKWGLTTNFPATHPYKSLRPISRQFAPVDISGCVLWIDAADATTVTLSGNNITQLQDKSSNAYVFATASGFTYNVTKFNGTYPSFYSPTSTAGYSLGSNTSFTLNQPFTAFAVGGNLITPASGGYFWDSTSNANRAALLSFSPGTPTMFAGTELYSTNTTSFTGALILTCQYNTTSSSLFENGVNRSSTSNTGTNNAISLRLGAAWSLTTNWNGHICEILFFNRLMSTAERQQIEGYLANKWGLRGNLAASHPFKLYSALTPVFTPVQISGCQLWLDAYDATTLTLSGSNVTQWRDKSGNGNNATGATSPVYNSTSNGIDFTRASSQYMTLPDGTYPFNDSSYSYFYIFTPKSTQTGQTFTFGGSNNGTAGDFGKSIGFRTGDAGTGTLQTYWFSYDLQTGSTFTLNVKNFAANYYASGGSRTIWINFSQGASDTPGVARTQRSTMNMIGAQGSGGSISGFLDAQIHEYIVYNTSLPISQRQAIEGYLANKWGLVGSLPASHPYKKFIN